MRRQEHPGCGQPATGGEGPLRRFADVRGKQEGRVSPLQVQDDGSFVDLPVAEV